MLNYEESGQSTSGTTAGKPSDSVLLLVHGFPFHSGMWRPQLDQPPPGWRVIAPDLPGFGGSPLSHETLTMDHAADALAGLLGSLGVRRAVVCGLSMGGYIALALFRRHPNLVRALVLSDTKAGADGEAARKGRHAAVQRVTVEGTAGFVDDMLSKLLSPHTRRGQPGVEDDLRAIMMAAPAESVAAALRGMAERPDSSAQLQAIMVPTQVIVGSDDEITPVAEAQFLARGIRGAILTVVPDAGHVPNLENPTSFNRTLHTFLGALPA
jgi:pimeloyl-ACP methyl ester carboxylesterase